MPIASYITSYDENLSGDSFIDPLGVLVIWSCFGERIFRKRVNSISNDVRNYTLNLIHHAVIKSLVEDDAFSLSPSLEKYLDGGKDSFSFKLASLIYLENLFTFTMLRSSRDVELSGLLGASKGRRRLDEDDDPLLLFTHKKEGHLLVRQPGLGVSGRYKTPFVEMGFFNGSYHYHVPGAAARWEEATKYINHSARMRRLFNLAREQLAKIADSATAKPNRPAHLRFSEHPESLLKAYKSAFSTTQLVGEDSKSFWLSVTGLNQGSAGALLKVIEEPAARGRQPYSAYRLVREAAERLGERGGQHEEREKLEHILCLEPLLAEVELIFMVARAKRRQTLSDVENLWGRYGRNADTLPSMAQKVRQSTSLLSVPQGTARGRLLKLLEAAEAATIPEQLAAILEYHANVMKSRGQPRWIDLDPQGRIHVHARVAELPDLEKWKKPGNRWVNSYYIPQFRNLVSGFQGVKHEDA